MCVDVRRRASPQLNYELYKKHLELLSRLELPDLFLTKEVLYLLSYNSPFKSVGQMPTPVLSYYFFKKTSTIPIQ